MDNPALLGDLPKIFDRNFAVGFALPAVLLITGAYLVLLVFDLRPEWMIVDELVLPLAFAVLGIVWVTAIALLAINRPFVRFLEGYGRFNPLALLFGRYAKRRFRQDVVPTLEDQDSVDAARKAGETEPRIPGHPKKLLHAVENYPDLQEWVLPTSFGNRYRSIEVYSRVVYGMTLWRLGDA